MTERLLKQDPRVLAAATEIAGLHALGAVSIEGREAILSQHFQGGNTDLKNATHATVTEILTSNKPNTA